MPRLPILALGLLTTLALSAGPALADDPAKSAKAAEHAPAPAHAPADTKEHAPAAAKSAGGQAVPASSTAAHHEPAHNAGGHDTGKPPILEPQPSLAIWTVAVFVILLLILGKFAWGPILQALHDREEHIERALHEAEKARNDAERIMIENRKQLAAVADQVRELIEKGRADAQITAESIVQKAHAEADASLQRAAREIQAAKDTALTDIFAKSADLAVTVAGRVLSKSLDDNEHKRLISAAIAELPSASNGRGGQV